MARNGSGTYERAVSDYVAGTVIDEGDVNQEMDDIGAALTGSIAADGQTTTTNAIPFAQGIETDTVAEKTAAAGVTIDGVLLKDGSVSLGAAGAVVFEGATPDDYETTLSATDATADRAITLPDASGAVMLNLVEDTTPQLGGDLDVNGNGLVLPSGTFTDIIDDDSFATASATTGASSESIKAYVDGLPVYTPPAGTVLQTLQTVVTVATATIASSTPAAITDLAQSITTAADANKVLVRAMVSVSGDTSNGPFLFLKRDSTNIGIATSGGSRTLATANGGALVSSIHVDSVYIEFLDSPGTAGTYAYSVYWARLGGSATLKLNAQRSDTDASGTGRVISTITVQEIKG